MSSDGRRDTVYRNQPSLFDAPLSKPAVVLTEQERQLERVKSSIGDVIMEFFASKKVGDRFFASDLHRFVESRAQIAPASADRVMRQMRTAGQVGYFLVSRSRSEYQVQSVLKG